MTISLTPQTQTLLETQMKKGGFSSPDEAVRFALESLDHDRGELTDDLDPETQAAIERAFEQSARGEGRPWEQAGRNIQNSPKAHRCLHRWSARRTAAVQFGVIQFRIRLKKLWRKW